MSNVQMETPRNIHPELFDWVDARDALPEPGEIVLMAYGVDATSYWLGYRAGDQWANIDRCVVHSVFAWARLPDINAPWPDDLNPDIPRNGVGREWFAEKTMTEWYDVHDILPDDGERVLMAQGYVNTSFEFGRYDTGLKRWVSRKGVVFEHVYAWARMPRIKPPGKRIEVD